MKYIYIDWLDSLKKYFVLLIRRNRFGKKWKAHYGGKKYPTILYEDTISLLDLVLHILQTTIFLQRYQKNISKQLIIITTRPLG